MAFEKGDPVGIIPIWRPHFNQAHITTPAGNDRPLFVAAKSVSKFPGGTIEWVEIENESGKRVRGKALCKIALKRVAGKKKLHRIGVKTGYAVVFPASHFFKRI